MICQPNPYNPPLVNLYTSNFNDVWAKLVQRIMDYGIKIPIDDSDTPVYTKDIRASVFLDKDAVTQITHAPLEDMFEKGSPLHPKYPMHSGLQEYLNSFYKHSDEYEKGREQPYTYGLRIQEYRGLVDQVRQIAENFERYSRKNKICIWDAEEDLGAESPPCLQGIWLRKTSNRHIVMSIEFRSNDIYKAWQWNMVGITSLVDDCICAPNNVVIDDIWYRCDSAHIYDTDWDNARKVRSSPLGHY